MTVTLTTDDPLVSILTPSFNQGRFLGQCIESVRNQSYRPIEHIVCDGGSADETLDVLRHAPETVSWLSEPDRGQSHALNKALARSGGEIIGWLNSDDAYFDRSAVAHAVDLFRRHPEVNVVYGHAALVNAEGEILHLIWVPTYSYRLLRIWNFIIQPAVFLRRSILGETVVDEAFAYSMDRELWLRLGRSHRFKRLDKVVAVDRHHPDRKVYTRPDLAHADEVRLVARYDILPRERVRTRHRLLGITRRLLGVRLVPSAFGLHACDAHVKGAARLLLRQVAVPRAAMPIDTDDRR